MKIVKKIVVVCGIVLSLAGIAKAEAVFLNTHNFGNGMSHTSGTINGQSASLNTCQIGNITHTSGRIGNESVSLNTQQLGKNLTHTSGHIGNQSVNTNTFNFQQK